MTGHLFFIINQEESSIFYRRIENGIKGNSTSSYDVVNVVETFQNRESAKSYRF